METKKIALVSGANKGIGREIVRQLSEKGLRVYLGARDEARGRKAVAELSERGGNIRFLQLDVTQPDSIHAAAQVIEEDSGKLDILINNAGVIFESAPPTKADMVLLRKTFETNYFGAVALTQAMLPLLRKSGHKVIVNVSSGLGSSTLHGVPGWSGFAFPLLAYNSSKAALNSFTVLLANELRPEGFRVNSVNPGYVATDLNEHKGTGTAEQGAQISVQCALAGKDGPSGSFLTAGGHLPW